MIIVYVPLWLWTIHTAHVQRVEGDRGWVMPVAGSDSIEYVELAKNIAKYRVFSPSVSSVGVSAAHESETFRSPGYPVFIATVFSISRTYFAVTAVQMLLILATAIMVYLLVQKYCGELVARISSFAFLVGINPVTNALLVMSDALFVFLFVGVLWFLFYPEKYVVRNIVLVGTLLGCATLVRPIAMFLAPVLIFFVWVFYRGRWGWKKIMVSAAIILFLQGTFVVPWMVRNKQVSGVFAISSLSAYNLFHYNLPEYRTLADGISVDVAREDFESRLSPAARADQKSLKHSAELAAISKIYLRDHFFGYALFHIQKTIPFFLTSGWKTAIDIRNSWFEDDQNFGLVKVNISSMALRGDFVGAFLALFKNPLTALEQFSWLLVCLAGLYAIIRNPKNPFVWLCAVLICYFAFLTGPVSYSRYRLPVEPFMLSLAIFGMITVYKDLFIHEADKN